ncbi:amidohydrolase family protein [Arthrobacter sp. ISL-72]|uniref:metal-dependent hydrolase family protein n=1 Tax=Arthrobacter sp. ISL-72 TaxID=2819114 RepID=UPI001BEABD06|nr:amidohydrolase family protein [Arthrobacter sp. ISL-72]MBT2597668.1 amidohydrolase family protein [Arthrobacter sp. ISL-72]
MNLPNLLASADDKTMAIRNTSLLDTRTGQMFKDQTVVVRGPRIEVVGQETSIPPGAKTLDGRGMTLMPGLIDAHSHVMQVSGNFNDLLEWSPYYIGARAADVLKDMLQRGFTTTRDMGGADAGIARALEEGLIEGPRLKFGGPIIAPTGGHSMTKVCDGEVELRRAIRKELRDGADHIKLTVSGGVISKMRMESLGFTEKELKAAVEEAHMAHRYVGAHAYTAEAVNRALRCGIRSIEHGNYLDDESIRLFLETDSYYVPTLATYWYLTQEPHFSALPKDKQSKLQGVLDAGLDSLARASEAGVKIAYGTDLHGAGHKHQLMELTLRAKVQRPSDILRSATVVGAELLNMAGQIGEIRAGALADLLVVDGNPLQDIDVLRKPGALKVVMINGRLVTNQLS